MKDIEVFRKNNYKCNCGKIGGYLHAVNGETVCDDCWRGLYGRKNNSGSKKRSGFKRKRVSDTKKI